jgi:hypothetical protein
VKLSYAFLADYAQVENGKVYVFGGGVTILWRPEFPAPIGVTVVASFAYNNTEVETPRTFKLEINDADGHHVVDPLEGQFVLPPRAEKAPATVPLEAAFAITIAGNIPVLPAPGAYVVELSADQNHVKSIPFAAALIEAPDT